MAIVVWFTVGLALWHFTIFVPERFWQGIVGALLGCVFGALITGYLIMLAMGDSIGDTGWVTLFAAVPGTLLGAALIYWIGERQGDPEIEI